MTSTRRYPLGFLQGTLALALVAAITPMALAETSYRRVYDAGVHHYVYVPEPTQQELLKSKVTHAWQNPLVKQASIGAAIGAAAGLFSDRTSLLKGAGIGALVGTGTGLIDKSTTLEDKPLVKATLKGAAIGTGTGIISQKGAVKGALIGAGAGAGMHYIGDYLMNRNNNSNRAKNIFGF